jgi:hypothetical protein
MVVAVSAAVGPDEADDGGELLDLAAEAEVLADAESAAEPPAVGCRFEVHALSTSALATASASNETAWLMLRPSPRPREVARSLIRKLFDVRMRLYSAGAA